MGASVVGFAFDQCHQMQSAVRFAVASDFCERDEKQNLTTEAQRHGEQPKSEANRKI